ncbi:MAG TPA: Scr1 family TA system antitoxin-like transcriptional regulator [Pseudonocardiaceae bacterium]|nr:Scr1 family TA system antitoxin-like transcriptional regulator [Pseudonocardiaceae bacterium]
MTPDLRGRQLGQRIRAVRQAAGLSGPRAARALGISVAQLSRMESGHRGCTLLNVALLLGLCRVSSVDRAEILALCRRSTEAEEDRGYGCWVRPHLGGPSEGVSAVAFAYETANSVVCCEPAGLPVLLQTGEFLEADLANRGVDPARWLPPRRRHRSVLFAERGPDVVCFLHEATLRSLPVDEPVRQSQLIHLSMLIGQERLAVRIVPVERDRALMGGAFAVLRFGEFEPVVCVPCETVTLMLEQKRNLAAYEQRLRVLDRISLSERDSAAMIMSIIGRSESGFREDAVATDGLAAGGGRGPVDETAAAALETSVGPPHPGGAQRAQGQ